MPRLDHYRVGFLVVVLFTVENRQGIRTTTGVRVALESRDMRHRRRRAFRTRREPKVRRSGELDDGITGSTSYTSFEFPDVRTTFHRKV